MCLVVFVWFVTCPSSTTCSLSTNNRTRYAEAYIICVWHIWFVTCKKYCIRFVACPSPTTCSQCRNSRALCADVCTTHVWRAQHACNMQHTSRHTCNMQHTQHTTYNIQHAQHTCNMQHTSQHTCDPCTSLLAKNISVVLYMCGSWLARHRRLARYPRTAEHLGRTWRKIHTAPAFPRL